MKNVVELSVRALAFTAGIGIIAANVVGDCSHQYEYVNEWRFYSLLGSVTCERIHGMGETCQYLRTNNVTAFTDRSPTMSVLDTDHFADCSAPCGSQWPVQTTQVDIESDIVDTDSVNVFDCCQTKECES